MVFTVLGAVAGLERSRIAETCPRWSARNARAKGKRLGGPRASVPLKQLLGGLHHQVWFETELSLKFLERR